MAEHPATFSQPILDQLKALLPPGRLLDPFCGVGKIHGLRSDLETWGVELEFEWASMSDRTLVGSALDLPFPNESFDIICTSPCYGSRMADHHEAKDNSKRYTYRHALGRMPSKDSSAVMQFGGRYKNFHELAWEEATRVLKPRGWFFLNISNHIRKGTEQPVVEWHVKTFIGLGYYIHSIERIETRRMKNGANRDKRVDSEKLVVMRRA